MHKLMVKTSVLAAVLAFSATQAQRSIQKVEVGVFGQYTKLDSKVKIDNPIALGAQLSIPLYQWFGVNVPPPNWTFALTPATQTRDVGQTANAATAAKDADNVDLGAATRWASSNNATAAVVCNAPPPPCAATASAACSCAMAIRISRRRDRSCRRKQVGAGSESARGNLAADA